jgi:uncharacterized membrane protein
MFGLTQLGTIHTAISLVAIATGVLAFLRYRQIRTTDRLGQTYLVTTFLTAATGLGIFEHGGFGPPHVLSIMTLIALAVGTLAALGKSFGRSSQTVQAVSYTSTAFFHTIPGFTESLTRLPLDNPVLPSQEAPEFQVIYGVLLLLFVIGLFFQLRWLRRGSDRAG